MYLFFQMIEKAPREKVDAFGEAEQAAAQKEASHSTNVN